MIKTVTRKSMKIRPSGRSTDFISPSFGHGCLFECTYCYMKRHKPKGLDIADTRSVTDILTEINSHSWFATVDKPNQTHEKYITYDISCNEDFALHAKHHDWKRIFRYFRDSEKAMGSFATKTIPNKFLDFDPKGKIRIRFSLMPEELRQRLEPNTAPIINRIEAIDKFVEAGYDVDVNFSPVVVYTGWLEAYEELFKLLDIYVENKNEVNAEVIFLTHNKDKHQHNVTHKLPGESLLWQPDIQEDKVSQYGGTNIRYKSGLKHKYIQQFKALHNNIIPWNTIRYIF